jgi:metallo-beta-lactamase class B
MMNIGNKLTLLIILFLSYSYNLQASEIVNLKKISDKIYVVEDFYYIKENSIVYIGDEHVTLIGATWSPETAKRVAEEVRKITTKPIREVVNTDYQPDRSGGNAFWKAQDAKIISTQLTHDIMGRQWAHIVTVTQRAFPTYPKVPLTLPDTVYSGDSWLVPWAFSQH